MVDNNRTETPQDLFKKLKQFPFTGYNLVKMLDDHGKTALIYQYANSANGDPRYVILKIAKLNRLLYVLGEARVLLEAQQKAGGGALPGIVECLGVVEAQGGQGLVEEALLPEDGWQKVESFVKRKSNLEILQVLEGVVAALKTMRDNGLDTHFEVNHDSLFARKHRGRVEVKAIDFSFNIMAGEFRQKEYRPDLFSLVVHILSRGRSIRKIGLKIPLDAIDAAQRLIAADNLLGLPVAVASGGDTVDLDGLLEKVQALITGEREKGTPDTEPVRVDHFFDALESLVNAVKEAKPRAEVDKLYGSVKEEANELEKDPQSVQATVESEVPLWAKFAKQLVTGYGHYAEGEYSGAEKDFGSAVREALTHRDPQQFRKAAEDWKQKSRDELEKQVEAFRQKDGVSGEAVMTENAVSKIVVNTVKSEINDLVKRLQDIETWKSGVLLTEEKVDQIATKAIQKDETIKDLKKKGNIDEWLKSELETWRSNEAITEDKVKQIVKDTIQTAGPNGHEEPLPPGGGMNRSGGRSRGIRGWLEWLGGWLNRDRNAELVVTGAVTALIVMVILSLLGYYFYFDLYSRIK